MRTVRLEFLPNPSAETTRIYGLKTAGPVPRASAEGPSSGLLEDEWFVPQRRLFDPKKWTVDVASYFPEVIAKEFRLLWAKLPYQLHYLAHRFEMSRQLLTLQEDWDGNGGQAFTEEHWRRVVCFLSDNALWLWERERLCIPDPKIIPGPGRSIDVHWKSDELELLLNVPEDASLPASFYGDDHKRDAINGTLGIAHDNFWLMLWLTGRK